MAPARGNAAAKTAAMMSGPPRSTEPSAPAIGRFGGIERPCHRSHVKRYDATSAAEAITVTARGAMSGDRTHRARCFTRSGTARTEMSVSATCGLWFATDALDELKGSS